MSRHVITQSRAQLDDELRIEQRKNAGLEADKSRLTLLVIRQRDVIHALARELSKATEPPVDPAK